MFINQLSTRWRALHVGLKGLLGRLKKLFVNPKTWKFLILILRFVVWILRMFRAFM